MKKIKLAITSLITIASVSGFAEYTCKSTSKGYEFTATKNSKNLATKVAISKCRSHSRTVNSECEAIVDCSYGSRYEVKYQCESFSNGYSFKQTMATVDMALAKTVASCKSHSRTVNSECAAFTQCQPIGYSPRKVSCNTESNGYTFNFTGIDSDTVRGYVISRCQDHSRTINSQCAEFVECDGHVRSGAGQYQTPDRGHHGGNRRGNRLGFDFRERALMIANTVAEVSKEIEPFINNEQEQKIDEIKKQAIRLRARINGRRDTKIVRNTLFHLGTLLEASSSFIDSALETDYLDMLAEDYLISYESIMAMVDFLDKDFKGTAVDLY